MSCPRFLAPGDGSKRLQGTALPSVAGEKDGADGIMGLSFPASLQTRGSGAFLWAKRSSFSEDIACAGPYSMPRAKVSLSQSQSSEDTNADSSGNLPDTDKPYRLHQLWPRQAQAKRGAWRIPERTLILLAAVGGSIGAYAGMRVFHHKTRHNKFKYGVPAIFIAQAAIAALCYVRMR